MPRRRGNRYAIDFQLPESKAETDSTNKVKLFLGLIGDQGVH
jgi:hypothetical protein